MKKVAIDARLRRTNNIDWANECDIIEILKTYRSFLNMVCWIAYLTPSNNLISDVTQSLAFAIPQRPVEWL